MARHLRMQSPINSIKHYVQQTLLGIPTGTIRNVTIADAIVAPAVTNTFSVNIGSVIKAIYVEMWYANNDVSTGQSTFTMTIEKLPANALVMTFTNSSNLSAYLNKKNILYCTQGVVTASVDGGNAMPMYRGWIKIPKGKQRMGQGDKIMLNVSSIGLGQICGFFTYKEYQ